MNEKFESIYELSAEISMEALVDFIRRTRLKEIDESQASLIYETWAKENKIDITPNAVM